MIAGLFDVAAKARPARWLPRVFGLAGIGVIGATAALIGLVHYTLASGRIDQAAERYNEAYAASLAALVGPELEDLLQASAVQRTPAEVVARKLDLVFARAPADTNLLKVELYDRAGIAVYSTDRDEVGVWRDADTAFRRALAGTPTSERRFRAEFEALTGKVEDRYVVASVLPVTIAPGAAATPPGVFVIQSEVTRAVRAMHGAIASEIAIIALLLGAAYGLLWLVVWHGTRAIERAHAENLRLASEAARATASAQAKSQFLMNVSHELRTPLNAILGFSEIIRDERLGPAGVPAYRGYAKDIHDSGHHLLGLIEELLDLTRIERGEIRTSFEEVRPAEVVEQVARTLSVPAERRGMRLMTRIEPHSAAIWSDGRRLRQILINLVGNAIKFTDPGGRIEITVRAARRGDAVEFVVSDTGIGIDAQDIANCLAPFGRASDALVRNQDGMGLGLPLSKRFAELLGGTLALESEKGRGTTVTVTLPKDGPAVERAA